MNDKINENVLNNIVNTSEYINIGGIRQYILSRGNNKNNPIILFLHGGPGVPISPFAPKFQAKLEEKFIVVNWDQRGVGKSYSQNIPPQSMNIEQFISDTEEVVDYLLKKFDKEKIYLVGHSWGSILGINIVQRCPEKVHAYIGVGQVIDTEENERISYEFILNEAKKHNNTEAVKELEEIGHPPYKNSLNEMSIERKWIMKLGFMERNCNLYKELIDKCNDEDLQIIMEGLKFTDTYLFDEVFESKINYFESIPELKVPVYFCMGRYDYTAPSVIAEKYFKQLKAPYKEFIWFENSAHCPPYEETEKFTEVVFKVLRDTHS